MEAIKVGTTIWSYSFVVFFCFYTLKDASVYALSDFTVDLKLCLAPVPLYLSNFTQFPKLKILMIIILTLWGRFRRQGYATPCNVVLKHLLKNSDVAVTWSLVSKTSVDVRSLTDR